MVRKHLVALQKIGACGADMVDMGQEDGSVNSRINLSVYIYDHTWSGHEPCFGLYCLHSCRQAANCALVLPNMYHASLLGKQHTHASIGDSVV